MILEITIWEFIVIALIYLFVVFMKQAIDIAVYKQIRKE